MENKNNRWTRESAIQAAGDKVAANGVILLDGNLSLRQCSAADYLVNHCGYITREGKPE
jgi:hypothetical protein